MISDPLHPHSGMCIKQILSILREEREGLKRRIRSSYSVDDSDKEIEVAILGTAEYTQTQLRKVVTDHINQIYILGVTRSISDVSSVDIYHPIPVPAYITQADRTAAEQEIDYTLSLLAGSIKMRNEKIKGVILSRSRGITKLIEEVVEEINQTWIPRLETDVRIGMTHAYNAAYFTRVYEYAPYKRWVSCGDHPEMEGMVVPAQDLFTIPDQVIPNNLTQKIPETKMLFPGDISHEPDRRHLERCLCQIAPVKDLTGTKQPEEVKPEKKPVRKRKKEDEKDDPANSAV